ncbi:MAG: hypothetical protein MZV65_41845 [Chromatiales bacterium]|nr:hypothetical protein [Chromatiales bacterium]
MDGGADPLQQRREDRQELTVADAVERFCKARVRWDGAAGTRCSATSSAICCPCSVRRQLKSVKRSEIIALIEGKAASLRRRAAALLLTYTKLLFCLCRGSRADRGVPRHRHQARSDLVGDEVGQAWARAR